MPLTVYTIGHSNHTNEHFFETLKSRGIEVLVDVRSSPYSRYATWFNRDPLKTSLGAAGIRYLFLGDSIGGRPERLEFYDDEGYVRYDRLAASPEFLEGVERLLRGAAEYRVVLMCSEEDPTECHRNLLIGRVLADRGVEVIHIRGNGRLDPASLLARPEALPLFGKDGGAELKSTRLVSPRNRQRSSSHS